MGEDSVKCFHCSMLAANKLPQAGHMLWELIRNSDENREFLAIESKGCRFVTQADVGNSPLNPLFPN